MPGRKVENGVKGEKAEEIHVIEKCFSKIHSQVNEKNLCESQN